MSSSRLRTLLGVALLSVAVPCVGFGLPIVALTVAGLTHALVRASAPRATRRSVWPVAAAVSAYVVGWWIFVALALDAELGVVERAVVAAGATFAGLACAPLVLSLVAALLPGPEPVFIRGVRLAERIGIARVRIVGGALIASSVVPVLALAPLVGFVVAALAVAVGVPWSLSWAVHALATSWEPTDAPTHAATRALDAAPLDAAPLDAAPLDAAPLDAASLFAGLSVLLALAVTLAALVVPLRLSEDAVLGPRARAFTGAIRLDTGVTVAPHDEGVVVSVPDGGGAGLIRWAQGRPDRVEVSEGIAEHRVCVGRESRVGCVVVDGEGVRRDDAFGDRARRRIGDASWLASLALGLACALGVLGARLSVRSFRAGLALVGAVLLGFVSVVLGTLL